jgi:hypothetical protein
MLKYLSGICCLLWLLCWALKHFSPAYFSAWYIQWPAFALLGLLVPYGLAKSLCRVDLHQHVYVFLLVFVAQSAMLGVGYTGLHVAGQMLISANQARLPQELSLSALSLPSLEQRKMVAATIYLESGQPVMYQDATGQQVMYQPTAAEKDLYAKNIEVTQQERQVFRTIQAQMREMLYLSAYWYVAFLLVFSLMFSRERQRKNLSNQW